MSSAPVQQEDLVFIDSFDLADDTQLQEIVTEVQSFVGGKDKKARLRVDVLSEEQWREALNNLPSYLKRGQQDHIHTLPVGQNSQHLVVSPSAVIGINEGDRVMYHTVVSALVRAMPTTVEGTLKRGVNEILTRAVGDRIGFPLSVRTHPQESEFVLALARVLTRCYGFSTMEWVLELRRNPERCALALRRSDFGKSWYAYVKAGDPATAELLAAASNKRAVLSKALLDPDFSLDTPFAQATIRALIGYLSEGTEQT